MARQRKPTALKKLDGNPGKTPILEDEVQPREASSTQAPKALGAYGLAMWRRVAPELKAMGLWTLVDREGLEHGCVLHQAFKTAQANEDFDRMMRSTQAFRLWVKEFGFTPVSRAGLRAPGRGVANPFEEFKQPQPPSKHDPAKDLN